MSFNLFASASKTSIKVLPITFLFCSGSSTFFKCLRKISEQISDEETEESSEDMSIEEIKEQEETSSETEEQ